MCFPACNTFKVIDSTIASSCNHYEKQFNWSCSKSGVPYIVDPVKTLMVYKLAQIVPAIQPPIQIYVTMILSI